MNSSPLQTVSELNQSIKLILENSFAYISVIGEVSNLRQPFSGHQYFSLKDKKSQIKSVLFKMQQRYLDRKIEDGMQIICHGRVSVYEPRGDYQLIVDAVDFAGEGALQIAFEKLKASLAKEGLFDAAHKKAPPFLPKKVALVTSPKGAAVQDFLKLAEERCPSVPIDIYPVRVQGEQAAAEVTDAINIINNSNSAEVIVLCRGGGSIEDLFPFNDENLARTIFNSDIPIVSAIGHEIDFTIADLTADVRAPTPTAAVEIVMPNSQEISLKMNSLLQRISRAIGNTMDTMQTRLAYQNHLLASPRNRISNYQLKLDHLSDRLANAQHMALNKKEISLQQIQARFGHQSPVNRLNDQQKYIQQLKSSLTKSIQVQLESQRRQLQKATVLLNAVNPKAVLKRGYAIVKTIPDKNVVKSSAQVHEGDRLRVTLSKGEINCKVIEKPSS